jgi:hypothetical protein
LPASPALAGAVGRRQVFALLRERGKQMKIEKSLFIEGRLWFDKVNGNTYFSNRVWVDGKIAFQMGMEYGYEEQYAHRAIEELHKNGYFEGEKVPSLWEIRDEMGVNLYKVATYGKKSDLFKEGN